jgi:hypothetical protein
MIFALVIQNVTDKQFKTFLNPSNRKIVPYCIFSSNVPSAT